MKTRFLIIKQRKFPNSAEIIKLSEASDASKVVESWQTSSIHYAVHGTFPPVTWWVHDGSDFIGAMIASKRSGGKKEVQK